jgi:outer membrane autotransporter protein
MKTLLSLPRLVLLAGLLGSLPAQAQPMTQPESAASAPSDEDKARPESKKEAERRDRGSESSNLQSITDAPVRGPDPGQGPPRLLRIERGVFNVSRGEWSLAFDQRLSRHWVLGGALGRSRSLAERSQTEFLLSSPRPGIDPIEVSEFTKTDVKTNAISGTLGLAWLPTPEWFVEAALATQSMQFEGRRTRPDTGSAFAEANSQGVSHAVSLAAGYALRRGVWVTIPQFGVDVVRTRIDAYRFEGGGIDVGPQQQQIDSLRMGVQLQRAYSRPWGVLLPYGQWVLRKQLRYTADELVIVLLRRPGENSDVTRRLGPDDQLQVKNAMSLGAGLVAQFSRGVSVFGELSLARGSVDLRERRLAMGVKLER